jgi:ATP-dependent Clp protease adaptor protein ClpS
MIVNTPTTVLDSKKANSKYPEARLIVLDDNFNTFQHVANCLVTIIPSISEKRACDLTIKVDKTGSAEVWKGNLEQAELYHEQLFSRGLTMAPIEKT